MNEAPDHICVDCGSRTLGHDELVCQECWDASQTHEAQEPQQPLIQIGPTDI